VTSPGGASGLDGPSGFDRPSGFDDLFLTEVRRQLPDDIDVVARPAPIERHRRVDPRLARDEADDAAALAVEALVERWRALFPDQPAPTELRLRWVPARVTDAIGAEASTRQPDVAGAAAARIDQIQAVLDAEDWSWTRRDPAGEGNLRILGRRRQIGFDLGIRVDANVVLLRTRTQPVVVGALATELVETPVEVRPWPGV
jgi:hypothetical protein